MEEFKKLAQPIDFDLGGCEDGIIRITNNYDFTDTSGLDFHCIISLDGFDMTELYFNVQTIAPGKTESVGVKEITGALKSLLAGKGLSTGCEMSLFVSAKLREDSPWAPAGHRVAWEQRIIPIQYAKAPVVGPYYFPEACSDDSTAAVTAEGIVLSNGRTELNLAEPELQLWRAPTDNDMIRSLPGQSDNPGTEWHKAGIDRIIRSGTAQTGENFFRTSWVTEKDGRPVGTLSWGISADGGEPQMELLIELEKSLPELPRVGVRFDLPEGFETLRWYGRGLKENYPDRKAGYPLKVWESTVSGEYVPYILPQEHGAHCDTRWIELGASAPAKKKLRISSCHPFIFSALHSSPEDLDGLTHTWQVTPRRETVLIIDAAHRGLGTSACGPDIFDEYKVYPGVYKMKLGLCMG